MSAAFDLSYRVILETPLHCGTGFSRGTLHRAVARNHHGDLYVPGSTIKGRLRHAAESLAPLLGLAPICHAPRADRMCRGSKRCAVCRLFGSPAWEAPLCFADCTLDEALRERLFGQVNNSRYRPQHQTWERTQAMLNRRRRVAAEGHLFSSEFGVPDLSFNGRIHGRLPDALPQSDLPPATFLLAACCALESLGAGRSQGVGHCRLEVVRIEIDGRESDLDQLLGGERNTSCPA